jgi:regulator of replication initiation timing
MNDKKVIEAILELNPNIGVTVKSYDTIDETFNNSIFDNTSDKTMSLEDVKNKITELDTIAANEEADKETKKASGKQKLLDLGLTEAEVKALMRV